MDNDTWRFPKSWRFPPVLIHRCHRWIFHWKNHPAIGIPPWLGNPPFHMRAWTCSMGIFHGMKRAYAIWVCAPGDWPSPNLWQFCVMPNLWNTNSHGFFVDHPPQAALAVKVHSWHQWWSWQWQCGEFQTPEDISLNGETQTTQRTSLSQMW